MNGWIVLWTMKYVPGKFKDRSRIIIEQNSEGQSPEEQARQLYGELVTGVFDTGKKEVYSANLCEIKESTEAHYTNIE